MLEFAQTSALVTATTDQLTAVRITPIYLRFKRNHWHNSEALSTRCNFRYHDRSIGWSIDARMRSIIREFVSASTGASFRGAYWELRSERFASLTTGKLVFAFWRRDTRRCCATRGEAALCSRASARSADARCAGHRKRRDQEVFRFASDSKNTARKRAIVGVYRSERTVFEKDSELWFQPLTPGRTVRCETGAEHFK